MSWVLIYISTNFLAPIPLISLEFVDFLSQFPPKSTNSSRRISRKSLNRQKPALRPAKADIPAKVGPNPAKAGPASAAGQRLRSTPTQRRIASLISCLVSLSTKPRSTRLAPGSALAQPRPWLPHASTAPSYAPSHCASTRLSSTSTTHPAARPRPAPTR
jgi:hypothetical protein